MTSRHAQAICKNMFDVERGTNMIDDALLADERRGFMITNRPEADFTK